MTHQTRSSSIGTRTRQVTQWVMLGEVALLIALVSSAFAYRSSDFDRLTREDSPGRSIRIAGQLSCDMRNANSGNSCILMIQDAKSGKTFRLLGDSAKRLYFDGARAVAVEGILSDPETVDVQSVKKL